MTELQVRKSSELNITEAGDGKCYTPHDVAKVMITVETSMDVETAGATIFECFQTNENVKL